MQAPIRFLLLAVALVTGGILIATHGARGIAALVILALLATVPRTRVWRAVSGRLVQLTGSRRRAAALVMGLIIAGAVVVNVVEYFR